MDGRRTVEPRSLRETYEAVRDQHGLAWIGLYRPTEEEFASVAGEFGPTAAGHEISRAREHHARPSW